MIMERRTLLVAPLALAALAGVGFWAMLDRMQQGSFNPRGVPTRLMDKRVPGCTLPGVAVPGVPADGFGSLDLASGGAPVVVNFWASWCPPCVEEHPVLMNLKQQGIKVWGIAYKDSADNSKRFLDRHGNPFARIALDDPGRVAIDWGVTGVPESFIVDGEGVVRWHMAGPLTEKMVQEQLLPALRAIAPR
jgi:cytochrome c biogenesis protein CcmG/thiol:disulfide interchange protein DsbE